MNLTGIQAYAGQLSHMRKFSDRKQSAIEAEHRTGEFKMAVGGIANTEKFRCTGSCTGAIMLDIHNAELTELQWGTYLFMDEEYSSIEFGTQIKDNPFVPSLFVSSRVISANAKTHVTMDAGDKRFASKYGAPPRPVRGAPPGATFTPVSDEHGLLAAQPLPALGSLVELAVPHSDPTINLFDAIHVVSGDKLIDIWPIDARGVY